MSTEQERFTFADSAFTLEAWIPEKGIPVIDLKAECIGVDPAKREDDWTVIRAHREGPMRFFLRGREHIPRPPGYSRAHWRKVERERLQLAYRSERFWRGWQRPGAMPT